MPLGRVDALRVMLNNGRGELWVQSVDLHFDADRKVVMTDLNRHDLHDMTQEIY
jgi:hypothetical protein